MKKIIVLLYLINNISYSSTIEEAQNSFEYLLATHIWNLIFSSTGVILMLLFFYYLILLISLHLKNSTLYLVLDMGIFKNKFDKNVELSNEIYIKALKTVSLVFIWLLNIFFSKAFNAFPFLSILIFIAAIKPFFTALFPELEKSILGKFFLILFLILLILSLGSPGNIASILNIF